MICSTGNLWSVHIGYWKAQSRLKMTSICLVALYYLRNWALFVFPGAFVPGTLEAKTSSSSSANEDPWAEGSISDYRSQGNNDTPPRALPGSPWVSVSRHRGHYKYPNNDLCGTPAIFLILFHILLVKKKARGFFGKGNLQHIQFF